MGIQLSDWVENIVGKGEIARYEQFLLFPQCFQKLSVVVYLWSKRLIILMFWEVIVLGYLVKPEFSNLYDQAESTVIMHFWPKYCTVLYSRILDIFSHSQTSQGFYMSAVQVFSFKNTVGKGEIACNVQLFLFSQCFLLIWITFCQI